MSQNALLFYLVDHIRLSYDQFDLMIQYWNKTWKH